MKTSGFLLKAAFAAAALLCFGEAKAQCTRTQQVNGDAVIGIYDAWGMWNAFAGYGAYGYAQQYYDSILDFDNDLPSISQYVEWCDGIGDPVDILYDAFVSEPVSGDSYELYVQTDDGVEWDLGECAECEFWADPEEVGYVVDVYADETSVAPATTGLLTAVDANNPGRVVVGAGTLVMVDDGYGRTANLTLDPDCPTFAEGYPIWYGVSSFGTTSATVAGAGGYASPVTVDLGGGNAVSGISVSIVPSNEQRLSFTAGSLTSLLNSPLGQLIFDVAGNGGSEGISASGELDLDQKAVDMAGDAGRTGFYDSLTGSITVSFADAEFAKATIPIGDSGLSLDLSLKIDGFNLTTSASGSWDDSQAGGGGWASVDGTASSTLRGELAVGVGEVCQVLNIDGSAGLTATIHDPEWGWPEHVTVSGTFTADALTVEITGGLKITGTQFSCTVFDETVPVSGTATASWGPVMIF